MWHVLYAGPNAELPVCKYFGLHGVEGYAPQFPPSPRTKPESVRFRRHRWVFPGYVFFKTPDGFNRWDVIRWTPGVRRILDVDGSPATVSDDVVERLRLRLAERQLTQLTRSSDCLRAGQPVVIQSGPLRMVDAIFEKRLPALDRVQLLVQLMGRQLAVEVDEAALGNADRVAMAEQSH